MGKGRRVEEKGKTAQRGACSKESYESVEGDPSGRAPARIVVDVELFEVWPCGPQLYEIVVCQAYSLVEVDL